MKHRHAVLLLVVGWVGLIAGIGLHARDSAATKAAIYSQLSAGFSGLTGAVSPTSVWDKTATAIHNGVIVGTSTNDSASAGQIGEHVKSAVSFPSRVGLAPGVTANVTSISLTAGDWDVTAIVGFGGVPTGGTYVFGGISTTSGVLNDTTAPGDFTADSPVMPTGNAATYVSLPNHRLSLSATTTVYLVAKAAFTGGAVGGFGRISARRVR